MDEIFPNAMLTAAFRSSSPVRIFQNSHRHKTVIPVFQYLPERVFTHTSLAVDHAGAGFVSRTLGAGGLLDDVFLVGFDPV
jgi:hypothetical protein